MVIVFSFEPSGKQLIQSLLQVHPIMTSPDTEINLDGKAGDNYKVEPEEKNGAGGAGARVGSAFQVGEELVTKTILYTLHLIREAVF